MSRKKMRNGWIAILVVVCLVIGLRVSYKTMAGELENIEQEVARELGDKMKFDMERSLTEVEEEFEEERVVIPSVVAEEREESEEEALEEKKEVSKKKEEKKKVEKKKNKNAFRIELSEKDLNHLYRLVQSEVGNMDEKSKMLVASVVLNRVNNKRFPNTVSGVVLQKIGRTYQFSPVAPGKRFWTCTVSESTKKAVDKVLKNGDYSKGALYFVAKAYTTKGSWFDRNLKWILKHGGQDYYKEF